MNFTIGDRRKAYSTVGSDLMALDDDSIRRLANEIEIPHIWNTSGSVDFGQSRVFVKRKPVTERELEHGGSTRNLYRLPMSCNYGVGSPGFGFQRELVSSATATNWVLEGEVEGFPLLYHHRIIPLRNPKVKQPMEGFPGFVRYWGSSKGVGRIIEERAKATHEAVLIFEHIPHVMSSWLQYNTQELGRFNDQAMALLEHLRRNEIVHMDAHLSNFLTDGNRFYLTDFELSLSPKFSLSRLERAFHSEHRQYDAAESIAATCNYIHVFFLAASKTQRAKLSKCYSKVDSLSFRPKCTLLLENLEEILHERLLDLPRPFVSFALKYRELAYVINDFLFRLASSNSKRARLDHRAVAAALSSSGVSV